jgi:hypothetical protein
MATTQSATESSNQNQWTTNKESFIKSVKPLINFDIMNDEQIFDEFKEIQYYISKYTSPWL